MNIQVVQVVNSAGSSSGSMVALKLFPPTIWWRWAEPMTPGLTRLVRTVRKTQVIPFTKAKVDGDIVRVKTVTYKLRA